MAEPIKPGTVAAVAPDGTPIVIPLSEVGTLQRGGEGHVMAPAEQKRALREIELRDKLGGVEGWVAPELAGAASGLTFGLSNQLLAGLSPEIRTRLADYQEFAPQAVQGGELLGMAGGALLGVGAPALAERMGLAAVEASGLGKIGSLAVRGAVEGGAFGAGDAIGESALSDHGLSAEALVGGAAHGALGGAVAMGALGAAGKALSSFKAARVAEGFDGLAANKFGEAASGVGRELGEAEAAASSPYRASKLSAADELAYRYIDNLPSSTPAEQAKHAEAWAARERVFQKNAEVVENASRNVSQALDEALVAGRQVDMASFGDAKVNHMSKLVDNALAAEQASATYAWLREVDPVVRSLASDVTSAMKGSDLKMWEAWSGKVMKAIEAQDSLTMHSTLDEMKRWVGRQAQFGRGPFGLTKAAREFDEIYQGSTDLGTGGLKGLLENDVWGTKAAAAQRDVNAATTNMLSEGKFFTRKFTTEFGSDAGRPTYAANTQLIDSFMNKLTSPANDLDAKAFESWVQARRHFLDATERSYQHAPDTVSAIAKERAALAKLDGVYRQTTKDVTVANQVRAALNEERARGMGGAIGAVLDIASKPYTTLQRLAQIEAQTKGVLGKIAGGARELVGTSGEKAGARPRDGGGGKFFTALLDGLKPSPTVATAAGAFASRKLFARRAEQIGALQGNPIAVTDRVAKALGPVASASPSVVGQATTVALTGLNFLASKLPPSRQDPYSLQPQLQPTTRASDAEISRFMRYAQAIDDPLIVLREAKAGTLTRDHVEAVQTVYPKLYDEIRGSAMRALVESKSELPYARRLQLGILLDLPADRTLAPDFQQAIQATFNSVDQAGAESPPQTGAAPDIASSMQTATQASMERVQ